jgi:hypothetical protein
LDKLLDNNIARPEISEIINMGQVYDKIAFVVGAGAVENAWQPVVNVLRDHAKQDLDSNGANFFFARLIYLMRFYATGTFAGAEKATQKHIEYVNTLKIDIANALREAEISKKIKTRKEFKEILYRFVFSDVHTSVLITANWDTVIDNVINELGESNYPHEGSNIESFHIHGSINSPNTIYLPSEVVREPYRTKKEDSEMGTSHGILWRALEDCTKTILYGLSLDPLDAELCQILAAGWSSPNLKEIHIINPNHLCVAKRVKLLLDSRYPAKILGYMPNNLTQPVEY